MSIEIKTPPSVNYATGNIQAENLVEKSTTLGALEGVFADEEAYASLDKNKVIYRVEMLPAESADGELNFGTSHIEPGCVGNEYHMTRGHFHERIEQAEYYFGSAGEGLLVLQDQQGQVSLEKVFPGSVHHIQGYVAHRLVNTGDVRLSALAVWPAIAGHDYGSLKEDGFNVRIFNENGQVKVEAK